MKRLVLVIALAAGQVAAQSHRMEITLERREGSDWKRVEPGLIFANGDRIRFRFRANFDGYLYVMNYGTSGRYTLLFPREETGQQNRIEAGKEYQVPATQAWFRIDGPPGHDVVYWLVSPLALEGARPGSGYIPLPPPPKEKPPPSNLLPRCDDAIFRARGLCIDSSAGPRNITATEQLPENLSDLPNAHSRELVIMQQQESSVISSPVPLKGPVIYEFRLAHK
jgi:hypothetical protein